MLCQLPSDFRSCVLDSILITLCVCPQALSENQETGVKFTSLKVECQLERESKSDGQFKRMRLLSGVNENQNVRATVCLVTTEGTPWAREY